MEDDLREEEMRIIALDYASKVFQGAARRSSEDVIDMAKDFVEYLKGE